MMKTVLKTCTIIFAFVFVMSVSVMAAEKQDTPLPILHTKTKTIAVFKNGIGFFLREGVVTPRDGWAVTEYVPSASLGSLWIGSSDKDILLEEVIGFKEDAKKNIEAISVEELLEANVGEKVKITYGDNKSIEGIIKSVPQSRVPEKQDRNRIDYAGNIYDPRFQPKPATIVIIDTGDGGVALNKSTITKVEFPKDFASQYSSAEKAKRIKFKTTGSKKDAKLTLSYLQKGITWAPGYLINIADPKKARITMKATLINDVEDLENADISFVVGYPNFMYADILSPMALEDSVTQFILGLRSGGGQELNYGLMSNITRQRVDLRGDTTTTQLDYGYEAMKGLSGSIEEDLFFYSKENVAIKKGERADYHIFSAEVDYKHVYEWEIPDTMNIDPRGHQRTDQTKKEKEYVWHSVKLTNSTNYPWTTAPAFVVSGASPLAQDTLNYTPKSVSTNVKLTAATDVKHERHEYEIERQRDVRMYNYNYDLVTVKGELRIKNLKNKDITMEIKKSLTGEVLETSHTGKIQKSAEGLRGVNQNSTISWEIPLKAGEEITVIYKYKVYIAR